MQRRRRAGLLVVAVVATAACLMPSAAASTGDSGGFAVPAAGTFYPTAPQRLLGGDGPYAVPAGGHVSVRVTGREGLPSGGVSAALVNVTLRAPGAPVTLAVPAAGNASAAPVTTAGGATLMSVPAAATRSSLLTVPLGAAGSFDLTTRGGAATLTADLLGFYGADDTVVGGRELAGGYQPLDPKRLYDSRAAGGPIAPADRSTVAVDLGDGVNGHVTALALQVTAVDPSQAGSLTVSTAGESPDLSTVSFSAGVAATNLAVVPAQVDSGGRLGVAVLNRSAAPTQVVVDLVGFYDDGQLGPNLRYRPLPPTRVVDTAAGVGARALQPGVATTLMPPDTVAGDNSFALVGVLTTWAAAGPTDLSVSAGGTSGAGDAGSVHVSAGSVTSTPVQSEIAPDGTLELRTGTAPADVTLDVVGSFEAYPEVSDPSTRGWVPAVPGWQIGAVAR